MNKTKNSLVFVLPFLYSQIALAATLSLDQILQLHSAGVGDTVIAHQVEANGISFEPDAPSLLTLRKAGLTDTVLDAIVKATPGTTKAVGGATASDQVGELYKARKYPELADLLQGKVRANSVTDREWTILILTLLKLDNLQEAKLQSEQFRAHFPMSSYAPQLGLIIDQADERARLRTPIDDAIKNLNYNSVVSIINGSKLLAEDKRDMLIDAAVIAADFDGARQLLANMAGLSYVQINHLKDREQRLKEQEKDFKAAQSKVDNYIYSRGAVSDCDGRSSDRLYVPVDGRSPDFTVQAYIEAVRALVTTAPLSEETFSRVFHATMISSKYADVEQMGDKILAATGRVRATGFGANGFVTLIIDREHRRLLTEPDDHPFLSSDPASNITVVPFNLAFSEVKGLTQSARGTVVLWPADEWMNTSSYAIKIEPAGVIPQYPLMDFINCSIGHNSQLRATYNLGAYIRHVVGLDDKRTSLVTPGEDRKPGGMGFMTFMAAAGMTLGVNNSAEFLQTAQGAHNAAVNAESRRLELSSSGRFQFSVADSPSVQDLESTLSLSAPAAAGTGSGP